MSQKKDSTLGLLTNLIIILLSSYRFFTHLSGCIQSDIENVRRNTIALFLICVLITTFFISIWFSIIAMIFLYFYSIGAGLYLSLFIILSINIIFLMATFLIFLKLKNNFKFNKTRQLLNNFL